MTIFDLFFQILSLKNLASPNERPVYVVVAQAFFDKVISKHADLLYLMLVHCQGLQVEGEKLTSNLIFLIKSIPSIDWAQSMPKTLLLPSGLLEDTEGASEEDGFEVLSHF